MREHLTPGELADLGMENRYVRFGSRLPCKGFSSQRPIRFYTLGLQRTSKIMTRTTSPYLVHSSATSSSKSSSTSPGPTMLRSSKTRVGVPANADLRSHRVIACRVIAVQDVRVAQ